MAMCRIAALLALAFLGLGSAEWSEAVLDGDRCGDGSPCAADASPLRIDSLEKPSSSGADMAAEAIFGCESNFQVNKVMSSGRKGLAMDDTTFENCTGEIPHLWPHSSAKVTSLRIFKPWGIAQPAVFHTERTAAWAKLKAFALQSGAKFLVGSSIGCNPDTDQQEWQLTKQFMTLVGAQHFMGVALGNENDLLFLEGNRVIHQNPESRACREKLFAGGVYEQEFDHRVAELDLMPGFANMPVTAVLSNYALSEKPFLKPVTGLLESLWKKHGHRFVFTFNLYPYFDAKTRCTPASIKDATDLAKGIVAGDARTARQGMRAIGAGDAKLWVGEVGWSTPETASVPEAVMGCKTFSSMDTAKAFYQHFLEWEPADAAVDHAFWFAIHNSKTFEGPEHFGLMEHCGARSCKMQN